MQLGFPRRLAVLAGLLGVYFVAGKLGLKLAFAHPSATPVWPPTGIALAAFLILGYRVWPAILLGAFLVNLTTAGSLATSIGIAVGNTLEGLLGAYLVNRFAGGRNAFDRAQGVFKFAVYAGMLATTVSATFGVTTLLLGGFADWARYASIWLTWWLGDAVGALVVAPLLVLWTANPRLRWNKQQALEAAVLFAGLFLAGQIVFGGLFPGENKNYPLSFVCTPFLVWAAFRFGQREAVLAMVLLSGLAIRGTLHGLGPYARETPNESLLLLQAFVGVVAVMTLSLAAVVSERGRLANALRQLAVSDSLTGLANYRRFVEAVGEEIKRSQRTRRPFALLLLDLDGLKKINDSYGHLVGSRALCRLADVVRRNCRAIDLAARFGGDEFAVILPETDEAAAWQAARRIREQLARDEEKPALSASVGVAMFRGQEETAESLLRAADGVLYEMKNRSGAKVSLAPPEKPVPR